MNSLGWFKGSSGPTKFANYVIRNILKYHRRYGPDSTHHKGYESDTHHFIPQYLACPHCKLKFDLVGKLEDMERHTAFLAQHLGLTVKSYYMFTFISIFRFCLIKIPTLGLSSNRMPVIHFRTN